MLLQTPPFDFKLPSPQNEEESQTLIGHRKFRVTATL